MASSILKVVFALSKSPHLHRELSNRPGMIVSHCTPLVIECFHSSRRVLTVTENECHTLTMKPYVNEVTLRGQKPPLKCC